MWNYKIAMATLPYVSKDALENLNTKENIKKDSNRYFPKKTEKFWTLQAKFKV